MAPPPAFFFSSKRRHTRSKRDWSSDVCSSDLTSGRWIHVTRAGWLEKTDLESVAQVASSHTAVPDSDTTQARPPPARKPGDPQTPGRGSGVGPPDTSSSPSPSAPVDPSRVESARRTVLYRSPEGQPAGTL